MTAYTKFISKFFILITLTLSSTLGYSGEVKKFQYIMGGGGEPSGKSTIFDDELNIMGRFVEKSDWDTTISFNGGHSKTEDLVASKLKRAKNAGSFTRDTYKRLVDEMIEKINSGVIGKDDQLMINFNTHGTKRGLSETTHSIVANDNVTVSLDNLKELADLAAKKGVKLAIIDLSCYAGNTIDLGNDKVCIVTATGKDQYGYGASVSTPIGDFALAFSGRFNKRFEKGKNLEELFLTARSNNYFSDFPMINTPEGMAINEMLYDFIQPYLDFDMDLGGAKSNDFSSRYKNKNNNIMLNEYICRENEKYDNFTKFLKAYEKITPATDEIYKNEFTGLQNALEQYRNYQKKYEASLLSKIAAETRLHSLAERIFPDDKKSLDRYDLVDLMTMDFDKSIKWFEGMASNESSKDTKGFFLTEVESMKKQKVIVDAIKKKLGENEDFKNYAKASVGNKSFLLSMNVATEAKKVYDTLYKKIKKPTSNPCRDFVL